MKNNTVSSDRHVVVALLWDENGRLFLGRRPESGSLPGFWEFPGGKVEEGEEATEALSRELKEEIGVECGGFVRIRTEHNRYEGFGYVVEYFLVTAWSGRILSEHYTDTVWVSISDLEDYEHLTGNDALCAALLAGDYDDLLTRHLPHRHQ